MKLKMNIWGSAAAVLAVVLSAAAAHPASASAAAEPCAREIMPVLPDSTSTNVLSGDPGGRYQIGTSRDTDENDHNVLWQDGTARELRIPTGHGDASPQDVNRSGEIVALTSEGDDVQGWRYKNGQVTGLPSPESARSTEPTVINSGGEIAGTAFYAANAWDGYAVVWSADNAVRKLPRPDGFNEARVSDIDDDGTVVGYVTQWDYAKAEVLNERAVAWSADGSWRFLPGLVPDAHTQALTIRNGRVAGTEQGRDHAVAWDARSGEATELPARGRPVAINSGGSVALNPGYGDMVLLQQGVERPLPVDDPNMSGGSVFALTDADVVYGSDWVWDGDKQTSTQWPVRWRC
ncbi:hypothetical protein GCM10027176_50500 [Actinoallomurus bryophytorum]|uniref:HAF family extracellular repeat protein n=2 Tax=Actinoallomurus bryophytorum TaxID=1490222 RepID=A0A543CIG0_9ACTN|nr:hypothetical protein FB559_2246 [Actinoallomurus bryophytorum]